MTIAEALNVNILLKSEKRSSWYFSDKVTRAIATDSLKVIDTSLANLRFGGSNIGAETVSLFLNSSNISTEGIRTIAVALEVNLSLTSLCLHNNNINAGESIAIADASKSAPRRKV